MFWQAELFLVVGQLTFRTGVLVASFSLPSRGPSNVSFLEGIETSRKEKQLL